MKLTPTLWGIEGLWDTCISFLLQSDVWGNDQNEFAKMSIKILVVGFSMIFDDMGLDWLFRTTVFTRWLNNVTSVSLFIC